MQTHDSPGMRLWSECVKGYQWPEEVRNALTAVTDLSFDRSHMLKLANENPGNGPFVLTFLTREYFPLGLLWAEFALRSGNNHFAIAAMDAETVDGLRLRGIPAVEVTLPLHWAPMARHEIHNGFDSKALALLFCRTYLIKFLLDNDFDVVSCDIDALLAKRLDARLTTDQKIAFQRVAYFPKPLARVWGFTACAGFVAYRACSDVLSLLARVLALQQELYDDQLALNLALLEKSVCWDTDRLGSGNKEDVIHTFSDQAAQSIRGYLPGTQISLTALPATNFWRHDFVPLDRSTCVLLHPNSPKSLEGKLEMFGRILPSAELDLLQVKSDGSAGWL
jgi:hypothetical protein